MAKSRGKQNGIFKRSKAKLIALPIVGVICIVIIVLANYFLNLYAPLLHRVFAGDGANASTAGDELLEADDVVRSTAEESMVLLYNEDNYLPQKNIEKVNLFGWSSTDNGFLLVGGGSGGATILDKDRNGDDRIKVDLTDAFDELGIEYNQTLYNAYVNFSDYDADYRKNGTTGANPTESLKNPSKSFYTDELMSQAKSYSNTAVAVISRFAAENSSDGELKSVGSYQNGTFLELTSEEKAMFDVLEEKGFDVIVVLNVTNHVELGFLEQYNSIKACIFAGIPGQSGAIAIPEIIRGDINPSGRLSDTLPYDYQTNDPTYANAVKTGSNIAYQEGIYFGYKWYETADADGYFDSVANDYGTGYDGVVQFPFGYGLSYTEFEWTTDFSGITSITKDGEYTVKVTVKNIGDCAGRDVVQLYGHAPYINGGVEKAERVLLDFAKTKTLAPNESQTLTLSFSTYDLASYDYSDANHNNHTGYELDQGEYRIEVMKNAHEYKNAEPTEGVKGDYKRVHLGTAILFDTDPDTDNTVTNLFTGDDAYADCSIDGGSKISYLSRKDCFANFPKKAATTQGLTAKSDADVRRANEARYDQAEVNKTISYGADNSIFLVGTKDENGNIKRVSQEVLAGEGDGNVELAYNTTYLTFLIEEGFDSDLWDMLCEQITVEETKNLIGKGGFQTIELYSVGKPRCVDKDGPAGFNNSVDNATGAVSDPYTIFCSETLTGCSFSKEIAYAIGEAQAKIGKAVGFQGWYGPGVNLHRSVYNSRNYEYYSEDATLSGILAANTVTGAYDNNLYCYIKHFAVSEAGMNPKSLNTWLTEQTLRESYLRPFEIAVKDGNANAIMSAFNNVGGVCAGYNYALLTDVLRGEWGFKGTVITDWFMGSGYMGNYELGVLAGNDLWLAGSTNTAAKLDLDNKYVAYAARKSVKNILYTFIDTNLSATEIKVTAAPKSGLVIALWVLVNVIFGLGVLACATFTALPYLPLKWNKATAESGNDDGSDAKTGDDNAKSNGVTSEKVENDLQSDDKTLSADNDEKSAEESVEDSEKTE